MAKKITNVIKVCRFVSKLSEAESIGYTYYELEDTADNGRLIVIANGDAKSAFDRANSDVVMEIFLLNYIVENTKCKYLVDSVIKVIDGKLAPIKISQLRADELPIENI